LADASAARFTRYPEGLASALEKIAAWHSDAVPPATSEALAALYIVNPVEKLALSSLYSTHPPTEKRIKILRSMGGRAGYVDYEAALRKIESANVRLAALDAAAHAEGSIAARGRSGQEEQSESDIDRARQVGDLVDRFANYIIFPCTCGMRIKLPPEANLERVECPRCGLWHQVPAAEPDTASDTMTAPEPAALPLIAQGENSGGHYERRDAGWESFRCVCGQTIQLGPEYPLDYTVCANCNRRIDLKSRSAASEARAEPVV
jgi:heat shock protein HtpX